MTIKERISAFAELGDYLKNLSPGKLEELHVLAKAENPWFTAANVDNAIQGISQFLNEEILSQWSENYQIKNQGKIVGIVMAGNIPLVGFHDLLCVLISGNILKAKLSSKDTSLMRFVINKLIEINKGFESRVVIADQLKDVEAIIATGSDNSSRYFDYYFSKYPNIIRKNRTSCAVLSEQDLVDDINSLGDDIFMYYGLGCRNVSKLYVPENFSFETFFEGLQNHESIINNHKYQNNYDYNKSIYLVNGEKHYDNGFLLLKPDSHMVSPISVLFYETYKDKKELEAKMSDNTSKIQCVVSNNASIPESKPFGQAQFPSINDYADGVDTMKFLTDL